MMKNKVSLIRRDPQITGSRIWNCSPGCSRSNSPRSSGCRHLHLCSVTESKWICFFFWLHFCLFFVIYSHLTQKSSVLRFFPCSVLPPRCENTPISLWGPQTEFPLQPQCFSGWVGNVVRWVVGKCLWKIVWFATVYWVLVGSQHPFAILENSRKW